MTTVLDFLSRGGPVMIPIMGLSVLTLACLMERAWFWWHTLQGEQRLVRQILDAATQDLELARTLAESAQDMPIGRFLLAPLRLDTPPPETFRLALEAAGDREFVQMRKGDKLLESIVGIAPLLGLLGTVTGLIVTFLNLKIGSGGTNIDTSRAAMGIAEALITTAGGMVVAIMALAVFRICVSLQASQIDYFTEVGNELELIYRQRWYESSSSPFDHTDLSDQAVVRRVVQVLQQVIPEDATRKEQRNSSSQ